MPQSPMSICGATSRLSKSLMQKLCSSESCKIVSQGGGDITILQFGLGSEAFKLWKEHYLPGGNEPDILDDSDPVYNIAPAFARGAIIPPLAAVGFIIQDVAKALATYAPLRKVHFNGGALPVIPLAFVGCPPLGFTFHHSTISAYKVLERIQTGVGLPNIAALAPGINIVQLNVVYSNCALSILLVKLWLGYWPRLSEAGTNLLQVLRLRPRASLLQGMSEPALHILEALSSRVERLERIGKRIKIGLVRVCGVFGLGFSVDSVHTSLHHGARRGFRTASASF
jgi:hypothetical protein